MLARSDGEYAVGKFTFPILLSEWQREIKGRIQLHFECLAMRVGLTLKPLDQREDTVEALHVLPHHSLASHNLLSSLGLAFALIVLGISVVFYHIFIHLLFGFF